MVDVDEEWCWEVVGTAFFWSGRSVAPRAEPTATIPPLFFGDFDLTKWRIKFRASAESSPASNTARIAGVRTTPRL